MRHPLILLVAGLLMMIVGGLAAYGNACCGLGPRGGHAGFDRGMLQIPLIGLALTVLALRMWFTGK